MRDIFANLVTYTILTVTEVCCVIIFTQQSDFEVFSPQIMNPVGNCTFGGDGYIDMDDVIGTGSVGQGVCNYTKEQAAKGEIGANVIGANSFDLSDVHRRASPADGMLFHNYYTTLDYCFSFPYRRK